MSILDRLPLSQKLLLLGVLFVASFGGFAYTAWDVVAQVGVGGPTYKDIIRSKDVVADVLPPPLYIIETHLVAHQAVATSDAGVRRELISRLSRLEGEFEERHRYWGTELREGPLREALLGHSYGPGHAYFETARRDFVPALEAGDQERARRILETQLAPLYDTHRAAIDDVVRLANSLCDADVQGGTAAMVRAGSRLWFSRSSSSGCCSSPRSRCSGRW